MSAAKLNLAGDLRALAKQTRKVATAMRRASRSESYRDHADELRGAASMMDSWAAEITLAVVMPAAKRAALSTSDLADCGLLSEIGEPKP